ncbi:SDR family oxidoreductase [Rubrobacter indicoceani]|uniref:SDR family oxidoreductase n=1 Tax=Rubrobacter indicoceani TaxID=2051957 RepID=UPI000E5A8563|nr:SDR family oxidoreductase [Rubrobacter indicoceani]
MSEENSERRIALVSGGNRGIGLEVCRQLAERGLVVVLGSRDEEKGRRAVQSLGSEDVHPVQLDVTDAESVAAVISYIGSEFGNLDVLVNNAGISSGWDQRGTEADLDLVREALEANLIGAWRLCEAAIPLMLNNGYGRIVNVSSALGAITEMGGGNPAYRVSKASLNALTRILASELRGTGILVNSVCPGWVATEMGGQNASRNVEEGAEPLVWAATLSSRGPTGSFFRDRQSVPW